jgi:hypothetical protein
MTLGEARAKTVCDESDCSLSDDFRFLMAVYEVCATSQVAMARGRMACVRYGRCDLQISW